MEPGSNFTSKLHHKGLEGVRFLHSQQFFYKNLLVWHSFCIIVNRKTLRGRAAAARQAHNLEAGGSSPSPATIKVHWNRIKPLECGRSGFHVSRIVGGIYKD